MSAFTPSGSGGATGSVVVQGSTNPVTVQVAMPVAGTEYSYTLPVDTKQYLLKMQGEGQLQLAEVATQSGTIYLTVPRLCFLSESDLSLSVARTLYFQSDRATQVLEIRYWT